MARRLPRLVAGLAIFGAGLALVIEGDNGLPGWDVLHQGISEQTPLSIGAAVSAVGAVLLVAMMVLRERIGIGTLGNVVVIGLAVDVTLWAIPDVDSTALGAGLTLVGPLVVAVGSGIYLGCRLGSGPRDGIMTAMAARGVTVWKARFAIEASALGFGVVLGGSVGWGTVWFMVVIGPAVQVALPRFEMPEIPRLNAPR